MRDTRDTHTHAENRTWGHREKLSKPRRGAAGERKPADTLTSGFQLPALWENKFPLSKPSGLCICDDSSTRLIESICHPPGKKWGERDERTCPGALRGPHQYSVHVLGSFCICDPWLSSQSWVMVVSQVLTYSYSLNCSYVLNTLQYTYGAYHSAKELKSKTIKNKNHSLALQQWYLLKKDYLSPLPRC